MSPCGERGQASLELLASVPAMLLAVVVALQLAITGYSLHLADGAAEAGALALAGRGDPVAAAKAAMPGWARGAVEVSASTAGVEVTVRPPAPLPALSEALEVSSAAWVGSGR